MCDITTSTQDNMRLRSGHESQLITSSSLPLPTLTPMQESFITAVLRGAKVISKTVHGISDTSCSSEKPALPEGVALEQRSLSNLEQVFRKLVGAGEITLELIDDVKSLMRNIIIQLNDGLGSDPALFLRTWDLKGYGGISHTDLPAKMEIFYQEFLDLWKDKTRRPAEKAAWFEHEFNGNLHPLADGCSRTSLVFAGLLLAQEGSGYPIFASREEYYQKLKEPLSDWTSFYIELV